MARVVQTEKVKKKKIKTKAIIILLIIVLVGVGAFVLIKSLKKKEPERIRKEVVILDSMNDYGYSLSDSDSAYYKTEYENLKKIVNEDNFDVKEYATQVSKMFIIDLYTLSTKMNKYDIGGGDYFHKDQRNMFEQKVIDTLYSTLQDNTYGDRKQELPQVKDISVSSVEGITYKVVNKQECYLVKLTWEYEKNLGYDDEASVVVCEESGPRWSVVDFQPTLKPTYKEKSK